MAGKIQFDKKRTVEKATKLFWKKGFRHTTMRDLAEATGLNESSLYNSFGSKHGLYRAALEEYDARFIATFKACEDPASPLNSIHNFWRLMGEVTLGPRGGPGCLYLNVANELSHENPEHGRLAKHAYGRIEDQFDTLLQAAQAQGEIAADHNTRKLARFLTLNMQGLMAAMAIRPDAAFVHDAIEVVLATLR